MSNNKTRRTTLPTEYGNKDIGNGGDQSREQDGSMKTGTGPLLLSGHFALLLLLAQREALVDERQRTY